MSSLPSIPGDTASSFSSSTLSSPNPTLVSAKVDRNVLFIGVAQSSALNSALREDPSSGIRAGMASPPSEGESSPMSGVSIRMSLEGEVDSFRTELVLRDALSQASSVSTSAFRSWKVLYAVGVSSLSLLIEPHTHTKRA